MVACQGVVRGPIDAHALQRVILNLVVGQRVARRIVAQLNAALIAHNRIVTDRIIGRLDGEPHIAPCDDESLDQTAIGRQPEHGAAGLSYRRCSQALQRERFVDRDVLLINPLRDDDRFTGHRGIDRALNGGELLRNVEFALDAQCHNDLTRIVGGAGIGDFQRTSMEPLGQLARVDAERDLVDVARRGPFNGRDRQPGTLLGDGPVQPAGGRIADLEDLTFRIRPVRLTRKLERFR